MKEKLIKKYQSGDLIVLDPTAKKIAFEQQLILQNAIDLYYKEHPEEREKLRHGRFAFQPVRYEEGVLPYVDASTGKPILNGENILTRNGTIVTGRSLDWLDWLAETGLALPGLNLPELQIEYNKKTKDTSTRVGEDWEDMNKKKENAPIATSEQWEQLSNENSEANDLISLKIKKRRADREANTKTPGVGSLALLGTIGPMAVINPLAFTTSLVGAKIGETALNFPFLEQGYSSFGDWYLGPNASETAKETVNLGTWLGGGFGWNIGKNLEKTLGFKLLNKPILLSDKYLTLWARENALYEAGLNFLNNYHARIPLYIEDVPAVELSSTPTTSVKPERPGVFYNKIGDINRGSIIGFRGHWQIRALLPGNPLSKRVSPDGTISWKNLNWYLSKGSMSSSDRTIIELATRDLPKDLPINYLELLLRTNKYIPKYTTRKETDFTNYGLDRLGYVKIEDSATPFAAPTVSLDSGIIPLAYSFHSHVGGNSNHYHNAIGHYRAFTNEKEPDILYITENQSDWAQQGLKNNEFLPSGVLHHMAETYQERQLLEILLRAYNLGKAKVRFPTSETAAKVEGFSKSHMDKNASEVLRKYDYLWEDEIDNLIELKYPEEGKKLKIRHANARERLTLTDRITELLNLLFREGNVQQPLLIGTDTLRLYLSPEDYIQELKRRLPPELLETDSFKEIQEKVERLKSLKAENDDAFPVFFKRFSDKVEDPSKWKTDPEILELVQRRNLIISDIRKKVSDYSPGQKNILNKYSSFPKHFRSLFGNKNGIRTVTDAKNNTWFEVDIPEDMGTRALAFLKVGDINEGSAVGTIRRPILRKNMHLFSDAEWDTAYENALSKGNKRELWRLLTLRFQLKAKEYVATNGGDPMILWRGLYREPVHTMKPSGVWLSSDRNYALNFTKDKNDSDSPPILDMRKVFPYFVKGHLETLFPHNTYSNLPATLRAPNNYDWLDLYQELIWRVPRNFREYTRNVDDAITYSIEHGATSNDIKNTFFKDPVRKKAYDFGKADVIVGHDLPMDPSVYPHWIPSQGIEYNVKNPNYVKLAKLITYDDNGNMIPLSLRFNFGRNDRRYGWLLPLLPFLLPKEKD